MYPRRGAALFHGVEREPTCLHGIVHLWSPVAAHSLRLNHVTLPDPDFLRRIVDGRWPKITIFGALGTVSFRGRRQLRREGRTLRGQVVGAEGVEPPAQSRTDFLSFLHIRGGCSRRVYGLNSSPSGTARELGCRALSVAAQRGSGAPRPVRAARGGAEGRPRPLGAPSDRLPGRRSRSEGPFSR